MQVLDVAKRLSRTCKFSSCGILGGEDHGRQRRNLAGTVDIVVATPGKGGGGGEEVIFAFSFSFVQLVVFRCFNSVFLFFLTAFVFPPPFPLRLALFNFCVIFAWF